MISDVQPASGTNEYSGKISYTDFLKGVKEHIIERVYIIENGKQAKFIQNDGDRGFVYLYNDPDLLEFLRIN